MPGTRLECQRQRRADVRVGSPLLEKKEKCRRAGRKKEKRNKDGVKGATMGEVQVAGTQT